MHAPSYLRQLDHWCELLKRECLPAVMLPVACVVCPPDDVDGPAGLWFCPTITLADAAKILRAVLTKLDQELNQ